MGARLKLPEVPVLFWNPPLTSRSCPSCEEPSRTLECYARALC